MEFGTLYICATPIGNLGDMSARCIDMLNGADIIAAEDTRQTLKLLNHFGISTPMTSYYQHNRRQKGLHLISLLKEGKTVALVSDAGTPAISDPGEELVAACVAEGIRVCSIPGAAACISALVVSGLPTGRFCFEGFLSVNRRARRVHLEEIKHESRTMIFYEAPHKLSATLRDLHDTLGDRRLTLARELTKKFEEVIYTTLAQAVQRYETVAPKGEFVLVIEGKSKQECIDECLGLDATAHVQLLREDGLSEMDAIKAAAKARGVPKNTIYAQIKKK